MDLLSDDQAERISIEEESPLGAKKLLQNGAASRKVHKISYLDASKLKVGDK